MAKALLVTVPLRKPSLAHTRTRALALPASCSIGMLSVPPELADAIGVHVEPLSRENSIETCSGSLFASVAVHPIGTLPLVKFSPPAGLLIDTTGAADPA